jgi:uncharacterized oxidoreductase
MEAVELDISDPASIERVAANLVADHPELNVLINNAGIMQPDAVGGGIDVAQMVSIVTTNLIGPIRMTTALIEHLKTRSDGVVVYTSSVLGFVPKAVPAVYSSTKAALHSYVLSQRFMLQDTTVRVLEIAPPWVRTELMNSEEAEIAMPLDQFIDETIKVLGTDGNEILVEAARPMRANAGPGEHDFVNSFNAQMKAMMGSWFPKPTGT